MATFTSYGATFTVPDRYAAGHALTEHEATALNGLMAEFISHKVRNGPFGDLNKGGTPTSEMVAKAEVLVAEQAVGFEFGAGRTASEPRVVDPVGKEAREIARAHVKAAIVGKGFKLGKKDEAPAEGVYPYEAFVAKVAEVAQHPKVVAAAKKAVAARVGGGNDLDIDLAA